jgi:hypothetical protein
LEWQGYRDKAGYGCFHFNNRRVLAHRMAWIDKHGPLPAGKHVLHHCDNPACIEDAHHFLGDQRANNRDKIAKARQAKGNQQPYAVLDPVKVKAIRSAPKYVGWQSDLARTYNVDQSIISKVLSRKIWAHVK